MRLRSNEEAVSPVIGVILMVAITVILAAVIAAFVFGMGGKQQAAPTASIVASNNPDTSGVPDMKIVHRGGDTLKDGEWKVSVVNVTTGSPVFIPGNGTYEVGSQIMVNATTDGTGATATNKSVTSSTQLVAGTKYDVKLVHVPTNAMLLDTVVEVR